MMPDVRLATVATAALAAVVNLVNPAHAAGPSAPRDIALQQAIQLDAARLLAMKAGEQIAIDFPVIGRQTVTFEVLTRGLDGRAYWHGRLGQNPRDRVFLKQTASGFVGAVRLAGRQVAFEQRASGTLAAADAASVLPVAGRAYSVGGTLARGEFALQSNLAALSQAQPGSEIALPLPGGEVEVAIVTRAEVDAHGFQQIAGISRMDGQAYPVHLTISPDAVFGSLITARGDYQILTRAGRTRLLDPRAAGLTPPQGEDHIAAPAQLPFEPATQAILRRSGGSGASTPGGGRSTPAIQPAPLPAGTINTTLNLLVTYSSSFVSAWGSELAARTRLSNLLEVANSAYANSGTGVRFLVVGWRQIAAPDDTPQNQLERLRLDLGAFEGTAAQKAQQGAALAVFFAPLNEVTVTTNTCGIAYVPGAYAAGLTAYWQQAPYLMYAALNDGQTGNQYCETLSLAHELGHNLGAVHDKPNAPFAGVFSYSHGKGVPGVFGTVMSYVSPRVALFSSPQLSCTADGQPCGTSTENVVATVLQTKTFAASLGRSGAAPSDASTGLAVTGWMLQANGTPYTGASRLTASDARVQCQTGRTGFYRCEVPADVPSVTLVPGVAGRTVTPGVATFSVGERSQPQVSGRFYVN